MEFPRPAYASMATSLVVLALLSAGCAARAPVASVPAVELGEILASSDAPETPEPGTHVVQAGETLWRIARAHGVEVGALARANGIDDPRRLAVGTTLRLPGAAATAPPAPIASAAAMRWPVPGGRLISAFGVDRRTHRHGGIDIGAPNGREVVAAGPGRVTYSGATMRGYGKTVIVDHGDGLSSLYAHNSRLLVDVGDRVRRGQPIARVGRTGNATTDHCHFEIRERDRRVDPLPYLDASAEVAR